MKLTGDQASVSSAVETAAYTRAEIGKETKRIRLVGGSLVEHTQQSVMLCTKYITCQSPANVICLVYHSSFNSPDCN